MQLFSLYSKLGTAFCSVRGLVYCMILDYDAMGQDSAKHVTYYVDVYKAYGTQKEVACYDVNA